MTDQRPEDGELNVVTGAFGFIGKYITRQLLARGRRVLTLTGRPHRDSPFGSRVSVAPFNFDQPEVLAESLRGATVLFNTYWVRFAYGRLTHALAVEHSRTLIQAAREAGVHRIVHVSITNPSRESRLPYFQGKALVEEALVQSGLSCAILRPTVVFGPEDILINNIAWLLRRFPVFVIPGSGEYRLQPIFVEDLADLAVRLAGEDTNTVIDAVGPEVFTFNELVRLIRATVGSRGWLLHLPPGLALALSRAIGAMLHDVLLTRDEVDGLMANLLVSAGPPTGTARLSDWLAQHADGVGARYASELSRHYRRRRWWA